MNLFGFIIVSLAVWRISHALVKEKGPLDSFARLRAYLASKQKRSGGLFDLFSCVYCLSIYFGLLAALWLAQSLFELITYTFAFSAISMLLEALFAKYTNPLTHVTGPAANNKITIGRRTTSK